MGVEKIAIAIEQKIPAGLVNVLAALRLAFDAFAQQSHIKQYGRKRKDSCSGKSSQSERSIGRALWIGKHGKRPAMAFLVARDGGNRRKGNNKNCNTTLVEF